MKIKALCLASVFAVSGCATCQQHPVWCAVGAAVVVGSVAATVELHHHHDRQTAPVASDLCGKPGNAVIGSCVGH